MSTAPRRFRPVPSGRPPSCHKGSRAGALFDVTMTAKMHLAETDEPPYPRMPPPSSDGDDFDGLFLAEYGKVVAIAHRVLADRSEAEDVAQEVFIDFHRQHPANATFAPRWLYTAAAHKALNRIRGRRRRERRELADAVGEVRLAPDPGQLVETSVERREVRKVLARLPDRVATILALRYSGLSYVEVGAAMQIGPNSVGTLLRRAEIAFRKEMKDAP